MDSGENNEETTVHVVGQCRGEKAKKLLAVRERRLQKTSKRTSLRSAPKSQKHLTWFATYLEHAALKFPHIQRRGERLFS